MEVINAVKHYQRSIERCSGNVQRMLHCLQKLYCLPVTVQHLQETGVGRTVNALRKYEGDTGEAAKALVNKWKAMVAEAESSDEEVSSEKHRARTESPPPVSSSHKHKSSRSESHRDESHAERSKSSLHKNHTGSSHSDKRRDENSSSYRSSKHSAQGHKRRHEDESRRTEEKRRRKSIEEEDDDDDEEEEDEEEEEEHEKDSEHGSHEEVEDEESDHISVANSESSNRKDAEEEEEEEEEEDEEETSVTEEIDAEEVAQEENHDDDSTSETEYVPEVQVKHKSLSGKHNGIGQSSHSIHRERSTHSSHSSSSSRTHKDAHQKSDKVQEKSKHSVDHRHSKKSEKGYDSSSKVESRSSSSGHSNKESRSKSKEKERSGERERSKEKTRERNEEIKKEVQNEYKDQKREQKSKTHIPKQEPKPSTSSGRSSSSKLENKNKDSGSKKVKVAVEGGEDGIDSFSGTSFADALGMMGMMDSTNKKKKKVSSGGSSSSKKSEGLSRSEVDDSAKSSHKSNDSTSRKLSTHSKTSASLDDFNLLDPSMKLEPLDNLEMEVDVDATLPAITPNYRPLPHLNLDMPSRARVRSLTEEEALSQVMSTKNQRTKVYSGVKSGKMWATVPSLYDICVRVLQENIDALEYTGGVPFDLLKPVLTHATPEQLFALEHYNPYLVEDTDELWLSHVSRKFRNECRNDMETHREMYQRCVEEKEAKLKALTLNIQNSMAKSLPVRQTKLAYVDSIAKPPRQVARKQAKFGTAHATATTPMAKVQKLASPASSSTGGNSSPVIHVPTPRTSHSAAKTKPRMAPLMQKTMKLAKSFKR